MGEPIVIFLDMDGISLKHMRAIEDKLKEFSNEGEDNA